MDKFTLVYEFNKESPLITYEAAKELEKENFKKASELFELAINKFPFQASAYFLYAVALAHLDQFDKAKIILTKGDNLLNYKKTIEYYSQLIEKLRLKKFGVNTELPPSLNNEFDFEDEIFKEFKDFDFLDEDEEESVELENSITKPIVTETLAEIYASQGNFREALDIYAQLKALKPEFREKYDNRIREINTSIENKKLNRFGNLE